MVQIMHLQANTYAVTKCKYLSLTAHKAFFVLCPVEVEVAAAGAAAAAVGTILVTAPPPLPLPFSPCLPSISRITAATVLTVAYTPVAALTHGMKYRLGESLGRLE